MPVAAETISNFIVRKRSSLGPGVSVGVVAFRRSGQNDSSCAWA